MHVNGMCADNGEHAARVSVCDDINRTYARIFFSVLHQPQHAKRPAASATACKEAAHAMIQKQML